MLFLLEATFMVNCVLMIATTKVFSQKSGMTSTCWRTVRFVTSGVLRSITVSLSSFATKCSHWWPRWRLCQKKKIFISKFRNQFCSLSFLLYRLIILQSKYKQINKLKNFLFAFCFGIYNRKFTSIYQPWRDWDYLFETLEVGFHHSCEVEGHVEKTL